MAFSPFEVHFMSYPATVYKVMIASPGDIGVTRGAVAEEIY